MNALQSFSRSAACITGSPRTTFHNHFYNILGLFRMLWFAIQRTSQVTRTQRDDCLSLFLWRDNSQDCLVSVKILARVWSPFLLLRTSSISDGLPEESWNMNTESWNMNPEAWTLHLIYWNMNTEFGILKEKHCIWHTETWILHLTYYKNQHAWVYIKIVSCVSICEMRYSCFSILKQCFMFSCKRVAQPSLPSSCFMFHSVNCSVRVQWV